MGTGWGRGRDDKEARWMGRSGIRSAVIPLNASYTSSAWPNSRYPMPVPYNSPAPKPLPDRADVPDGGEPPAAPGEEGAATTGGWGSTWCGAVVKAQRWMGRKAQAARPVLHAEEKEKTPAANNTPRPPNHFEVRFYRFYIF